MNLSELKAFWGALLIVWSSIAGLNSGRAAITPGASPYVTLWDTVEPVGDKISPSDAANWKAVPGDLLQLEKDPLKASSDPGYYGREYSFGGDAVVETPTALTVFSSRRGCATIYSKQQNGGRDDLTKGSWANSKIIDLAPGSASNGPRTIDQLSVLRNAGDEVLLEISFSSAGKPQQVAVFSFDHSGIVEVRPGAGLKQFMLSGVLEYGIAPDFIADDLIYGGPEQAAPSTIAVPAESCFLGLIRGESSEVFLSWPKGKQRLSLAAAEEKGQRMFPSLEFENDGQSLYVAVLGAPGIWHQESLTAENLEKDVQLKWKRPFQAKWKTQLYEEELKTTFAFRPVRGDVWRGVAGSYVYPAWFSGEEASFHLGKKIPPKGEAIIYCLEGRETPSDIMVPAGLLKQMLGRQAAEAILDVEGRQLRTHHRRGASGVRRACTCGCTEAIQAIFEAGEEVNQKDYIQGALDDMMYFVQRHVERINQYRQFADDVLKTIQEKGKSSPDLKPLVDDLEQITRGIPQECEIQKENMKTREYANALVQRTLALTDKKDPGNVKAYMELLKAWRDMGGAQDYVVAKCHNITRKLSQAAGYGCAAQPQAVALAQEVRTKCRQMLRHPDGYEVWADY